MREIRTSGLMSGERKRSDAHRAQATAPLLDSTCAQKARITSGGRNHPDSCRFDLVAGRRFVRVTGWIEAL